MKSKIVLLFSVLAVLALFAVTAIPSASANGQDNEVYFVPEDSSGQYCENIPVQIMVDAVDLTTGAGMDIYFDPDCVNITNVDFTGTPYSKLTDWTHGGNYVRIGVLGPKDPIQPGTHLIANLTLHCEKEAECISDLVFTETELLDCNGDSLPNVIWHDGTFSCGMQCIPSIEVNKTVWDGTAWVDETTAEIGEIVRFQCEMHNDGTCCPLTNFVVTDILSDSLEYVDNATVQYPNGTIEDKEPIVVGDTYVWEFPDLVLVPCETITIEFDAHVIKCGVDVNTQTVTAVCVETQEEVFDEDTATVVVPPKPGIEVNKTVWGGTAWVDETTAEIGENVRFRCEMHNDGTCCPLTDIVVTDILSDSLEYVDNATVQYPNGTIEDKEPIVVGDTYVWEFPDLVLEPCETITIEFDAHVIDYGYDCNVQNATAMCEEIMVSDEDTAYVDVQNGQENKVYFVPEDSYGRYCENISVLIMVDAVDRTTGAGMDIYFDQDCVNITNVDFTGTPYSKLTDWTHGGNYVRIGVLGPKDPIQPGTHLIANLTLHCEKEAECISDLAFDETELLDYNGDPLQNVTWHDGTFSCVDKPDLTVTEITVNYDASSLGGRAIGPEPGPGVHTECNNLSAVIEEENGVDVLASFDVTFKVDGTTTLCTVQVPGLTGGANKTVYCDCSWYPMAGDVFAINVTVDSNHEIPETNETNNTKWNNGTAVSNGYKGNGWQGPDKNLENVQCHEQAPINLIYSVGDSEYVSGATHWTEYTSSWTTDDLPVPDGASIEKAMLYVYYTWDKNDVMPDNVNLKFNDNDIPLARDYSDRKGFGGYDYPSGMLVYNVLNSFAATGTNNAILTKAVAADEVSMRGMLLMVVYNHPDEPERMICIDEGYDMLYAKDSYAITSEEATTYAPFTCCEPVPVEELSKATLIAVAPSASDGDDMNRLSFNDGLWQGAWSVYAGATQLGIAEANVLAYLKPAENRANFQSHIPAGETKGDFMDASNAFLILEKGVPCPAEYAVYQAKVSNPEGRLNKLRALRDEKLDDGYVTRYYEHSSALTLVLSRADSDLVTDGAQLLSRYSIPVGLHVQGMDVNERITRQDVEEALSFTGRLKIEVMKNRDAIGVKSTEAIIEFIDEFEGQVKASEGKTFSAALKSSIYYEGKQSRAGQTIVEK